jgi:hypothetical protein
MLKNWPKRKMIMLLNSKKMMRKMKNKIILLVCLKLNQKLRLMYKFKNKIIKILRMKNLMNLMQKVIQYKWLKLKIKIAKSLNQKMDLFQ